MRHKRYGAKDSEIEAFMVGRYVSYARIDKRLSTLNHKLECIMAATGI